MELIFPGRISRNGGFCNVTDLPDNEQKLLKDCHESLTSLLEKMDCPLHADAPVFVNSTVLPQQVKSTLFTCCVRFTAEVELVLASGTCACQTRCLPTRDGYGRSRQKTS